MRNRFMLALTAALLGVGAIGGITLATPGSGLTTTILSLGRFGEMDAKTETDTHEVELRTKGSSDVYVVSNTFAPGGQSGWHSHAGPSLITVKAGTVTNYSADDPTCTPQVYTVGMGFVDSGGGDAHLIRNEGSVDAVTVAVQILPAGAERRIDAPNPGNCPF
jgi:predicted metal-dependent enzyme (double-stranded beta helix superfamily)